MASAHGSLQGKTAIVTGGTRGIGAGICRELSRRGANVVIVYSSESSTDIADSLTKELSDGNTRAIAVRADLSTSPGEPERHIVDETTKAFGDVDILVNNAAKPAGPPLGSIEPSDFEDSFWVNTMAPMLLAQQVLPHLRRPARIINISSSIARTGGPGRALLYVGTKAALEAMSRCLAKELGHDGTTVKCVVPGPVDTDMMAKAPKELVESSRMNTPVEHRLGRVDDIAAVVGFIASKEARWISGQCINASGGLLMN